MPDPRPRVGLGRRLGPGGGSCRRARAALPALAAGEEVAPVLAEHVSTCLRCQAELARYRRMLRTIATLRRPGPPPDSHQLARLLELLDRPEEPPRIPVARLALMAAAAALAGAGAGVLWWSRRHGRHPRAVGFWAVGTRWPPVWPTVPGAADAGASGARC